MRSLIIILSMVVAFASAEAQTYVKSNGKYVKIKGKYVVGKKVVAPSYTPQPETTAWIAELSGTLSDDQIKAMDSLVIKLKADTLWSKADRIFPFAFFTASDALIDMKASGDNATAVNAPTFTAKEGYKGNGSSSYINTHFTPATDGVNWTLNSASMGVYVNEVSTGGNTYHCGSFSNGSDFTAISTSPTASDGINAGYLAINKADVVGLRLNNRYSSTNLRSYISGDIVNSASNANTLSPLAIYVFGLNWNDNFSFQSNSEISFVYLGGVLSSAQPAKLQAIIVWWKNKIATL